jgi:hypothetical protein
MKLPIDRKGKHALACLLQQRSTHGQINEVTGWPSKEPYARALRQIGAELGYGLKTGKLPNHQRNWWFQFVSR